MNNKLTAKALSGLLSLEGRLAKEETNSVLDDLPPGHPLLEAVNQEGSRGDIAALPDGHPLKVAIREAKERFVSSQAKTKEEGKQQEQVKIKKAKRLKDNKEYSERLAAEEIEKSRKRDGCKVINEKIDNMLRGIDELLAVAKPDDEIFEDDHFNKVRIARLQRLMFAAREGLVDGKLKSTGV